MASAGLPTILLTLPEDRPNGGRYFRLAAGIIAAVVLGAGLRFLAEVPSLIYHRSDFVAEPQQTSPATTDAKQPSATEPAGPAPMEEKQPSTTEASSLAPTAPRPAKSAPLKPAIQFRDAIIPAEPKRKYTLRSQRRGWYLPRDHGRWYGYSTRDTSGL
jgi:hypothetical protein